MSFSLRIVLSAFLFVAVSLLSYSTSIADSHTSLRSACIGSSAWSDRLPSAEIKSQLQEHFTTVIRQLEANQTISLLNSVHGAELASSQPWTDSERIGALIYLTAKRQQQIQRLRSYRDRGLFPVNDGFSDHAVPIFVDRNQTHCAVGYLMHSDGNAAAVREIVDANNLVYVNEVRSGSMLDWIRTSGLTQEEAAMIQPTYPIYLDATFQQLTTKGAEVRDEGFILSETTLRGFRFFANGIPDSFEKNPEAIDYILEQGKVFLQTNDIVTNGIRQNNGVLFGLGPCDYQCLYLFTPSSLPWLYIGSDDSVFGGVVGSASGSGDTGIAEIKYSLRSESGKPLSQFALTILNNQSNTIVGEQSALLVRSEIFDGYTDEPLGILQLFAAGASDLTYLTGTEQISLNTEFIKVISYGLVVGGNDGQASSVPFHHYFHQMMLRFDLGDVNQDGLVNLLDVAPFIDLLVAGEFQAEADFNQDGVVDLLDVPLFVDLLIKP